MPVNGNDTLIEPAVLLGQIAAAVFGLLLILIGVAVLYTIAQWACRGRKVDGVVVGVRRRGTQFYSVYRYALEEGGWGEANAVQGSGSLAGRGTGTRKLIRVTPERPDEAREAAAPVVWSLAFGFLLGGGWLTWSSLGTLKYSLVTWIVAALLAVVVGRMLRPRLKLFLKAGSALAIRNQGLQSTPVESAESLGLPYRRPGVQVSSRKSGRVGPVFCLAGLVVLATAAIPVRKLIELQKGTRTEGVVLWLEINPSNNHRNIRFPEVQFTAVDGAAVRFLDRAGANPSPYKVGDRVTVLYLPAKQGTAMIDRGWRNWEPVAALMVLGTTLLTLGVMTLRGNLLSAQSGSDKSLLWTETTMRSGLRR
ncbi:DUF3592 domain-containing protein [Terriglobus aquaticus]|uniref:DUF3592 domain-containing protein n=1 Tax=Terriglobus aquaticus TaxID=940139 RepID=A0ABW9KLP2_9BACT|nr:DUF3592 domain-containing protein [Terriglobus aquaticus]